ncbi:unnamed protein product [Cylindrotheca closterium]|uniref:Globin domain-containing protein n=1 Tax=Cylindrotheca closterium TaxID=2856 RepID=A0AAD2G6Y6_9STRA|nr:unnamed protein product [Cylindrotheca closterium]
MVATMSFKTINNVIETWETIRGTPEWEKEIGVGLFAKFFKMEPEAKPIFGFHEDLDVTDYKVLISPRFVAHAMQFVTMIDKALNMLGPTDEMLSEILMDIGAKHARYGVKPEYFPTMGKALVSVVGSNLGEDVFTTEVQESWIEVYNAMSHDMIKGHSEVYTVTKDDIVLRTKPQQQVDSRIWA